VGPTVCQDGPVDVGMRSNRASISIGAELFYALEPPDFIAAEKIKFVGVMEEGLNNSNKVLKVVLGTKKKKFTNNGIDEDGMVYVEYKMR